MLIVCLLKQDKAFHSLSANTEKIQPPHTLLASKFRIYWHRTIKKTTSTTKKRETNSTLITTWETSVPTVCRSQAQWRLMGQRETQIAYGTCGRVEAWFTLNHTGPFSLPPPHPPDADLCIHGANWGWCLAVLTRHVAPAKPLVGERERERWGPSAHC